MLDHAPDQLDEGAPQDGDIAFPSGWLARAERLCSTDAGATMAVFVELKIEETEVDVLAGYVRVDGVTIRFMTTCTSTDRVRTSSRAP